MEDNKPTSSEFDSVDPAPPSNEKSINKLQNILCDESERMFLRMRALFSLRNIGGDEAIDGLAAGFSSSSALLKHEIAYVLGQMQDPYSVDALIDRLSDLDEDVMVRHEAAEALGAIGDLRSMSVLEEFIDDESIVVSESCEVAIDLLNWVNSNRLDYS
ncbi:MAG: hypothetical protein CMA77_01240 [Euryarchaeota archaeon]|nr:hypothetical protein [Euryarchaeota archaeon]